MEKYPNTIIEIKSNASFDTDFFNTPTTVDGKTTKLNGSQTDIYDLIQARNNAIYQKLVKRGIDKKRIIKRTGWMVKKGQTPTTKFDIYEKKN